MKHRVCAECGCSLDFGEKCDCRSEPVKHKPPKRIAPRDNGQSAPKDAPKTEEWLWA